MNRCMCACARTLYLPLGCAPPSCPCSVRMQYLAAVAPALLGGAAAAKQHVHGAGGPSVPSSGGTSGGDAAEAASMDLQPPGAGPQPPPQPLYQPGAASVAGSGTAGDGKGGAGADVGAAQASSSMHAPPAASSSTTRVEARHARQPSQAGSTRHDSGGGLLPLEQLASLACGPPLWARLRLGLLEAALAAAQQTNNTADVWEVCTALLRWVEAACCCSSGLLLLAVLSVLSCAVGAQVGRRGLQCCRCYCWRCSSCWWCCCCLLV